MIKRFHAGTPLHMKNRPASIRTAPELNLTSPANFPTLLDVSKPPGPSTVASTPITHLPKSGGSAVADDHRSPPTIANIIGCARWFITR